MHTVLVADKKILDEKVKKLKMKKHIMEEAMQDMKNELCQLCDAVCKHTRWEKYAQLAVVMSSLIFAIVVMVRN